MPSGNDRGCVAMCAEPLWPSLPPWAVGSMDQQAQGGGTTSVGGKEAQARRPGKSGGFRNGSLGKGGLEQGQREG